MLIDLTGEAAGEADEAFCVLGEEVFGDARLAIEAVESGFAGETHEVAVAGLVFREDEEVLVAATEVAMGGSLREVEFAAQGGLDGLLLHGVQEVDRADEVA